MASTHCHCTNYCGQGRLVAAYMTSGRGSARDDSGSLAPAGLHIRHITTVAVVVVALVAAVVSYSRMYEVAPAASEQWRSGLNPLSIDGLGVAAS